MDGKIERDNSMRLHLGCGKRNFGKDWVHIDCADYPHIVSYDVKNLPFKDDSCELVYASHVMEYFDREEAILVLNEWRRVLKPNGKIRLAVPDFRAMATLYISGKFNLQSFLGPLYGKMVPVSCGAIYHKTVYDFESLRLLMNEVGFRDVERYDWRETEHAHIDDHSQAYLPHMDKDKGTLISLNVEAGAGKS